MAKVVELVVEGGEPLGEIRALNGINNGPIAFGGLVDLTEFHRQAAFPHVRLHDPQWPNPWVMDVPMIFQRFQDDAEDPGSYYFEKSDDYLQSIVDLGSEVIYRLGPSIEHTRRLYHTAPPPDFEKFARICVNIIRHYNDGWANGFHHGIRYWEIWNEPDIGERMWKGTLQEYCRLYAITAKAIKAYNPKLKVGGPAVAGPKGEFTEMFIKFCRSENLPLDILTWHTYAEEPQKVIDNARHVRDLLDLYGYHDTESHLNEWNYKFGSKDCYDREEVFRTLKGAEGAAFAATVLMLMQDAPVDVANYYTGDISWWGLFNHYGVPQKNYWVFRAFNELRQSPQRLSCRIAGQGEALTTALAGQSADGRRVRVMISHRGRTKRRVMVRIGAGLPGAEVRLWGVDERHDLDELPRPTPGADRVVALELPGNSVRLVEFSAGA